MSAGNKRERIIYYLGVPKGWKAAITISQVDTTVDMRVASDDHLLVWSTFSGFFVVSQAKGGKGSVRLNVCILNAMTLEAVDSFYIAVAKIFVPSWSVSIHRNKQMLADSITTAAS